MPPPGLPPPRIPPNPALGRVIDPRLIQQMVQAFQASLGPPRPGPSLQGLPTPAIQHPLALAASQGALGPPLATQPGGPMIPAGPRNMPVDPESVYAPGAQLGWGTAPPMPPGGIPHIPLGVMPPPSLLGAPPLPAPRRRPTNRSAMPQPGAPPSGKYPSTPRPTRHPAGRWPVPGRPQVQPLGGGRTERTGGRDLQIGQPRLRSLELRSRGPQAIDRPLTRQELRAFEAIRRSRRGPRPVPMPRGTWPPR
jgi:hypothetical protein